MSKPRLTDLNWSLPLEEPAAGAPCGETPSDLLSLAKQHKTQALRKALLQHGAEPAMILVILALMGAGGTVHIHRDGVEPRDHPPDCAVQRGIFDKYRPLFEGCLQDEAEAGSGLRLRYWDDACGVKAFGILCAMGRQALHELFTAVVASRIGCYLGYGGGADDDPLAIALAQEIGAKVSELWRMDEVFLKACKKPMLLQIAAELDLAAHEAGITTEEALGSLRPKALRRLILEFLQIHPEAGDYLPPPLRFHMQDCLDPEAKPPGARCVA